MTSYNSVRDSSQSGSESNQQQISNSSAFSDGRRKPSLHSKKDKMQKDNEKNNTSGNPPITASIKVSRQPQIPLPPPQSTNPNIISLLEHQLTLRHKAPENYIINLSRKLFPVQELQTNTYISLYRSLVQYITIMFNKYDQQGQYNSHASTVGLYGTTNPDFFKYTDIVKEVVRTARNINDELAVGIQNVLERNDVRDKIIKTRNKTNNGNNNQRKEQVDILSSVFLKPKVSPNLNTEKYNFDFKGGYKQDSSKIAESYIKDRTTIKNLLPSLLKESYKKCAICEKDLQAKSQQKYIFQCHQCKRQFHKACNPRLYNCIFCQLRNMNPLKQIQEELFVGILKKNTKRHEIDFKYKQDPNQTLISSFIPNKYSKSGVNTSSRVQTIQIRSLRVKDFYDPISSYSILFPDACSVTVNNRLLKQFIPLHRQSSLKYRRDEPIKLSSNMNLKKDDNHISIVERFLRKDLKNQERVEPENHLLGVYIIKQPSDTPKQLVQKYKRFSFAVSQKLLKQCLLISSDETEIACQTTKISLICSLTLGKMNYPGRGIFCKHFTCFDILNFLLLNSQLSIPKWQCPICKAPAYDFKIDPIMSQILAFPDKTVKAQNINPTQNVKSKNKKPKEIIEVIFDAEMNFCFVDEDSNRGENISIYNLPIPDIGDKIIGEDKQQNVNNKSEEVYQNNVNKVNQQQNIEFPKDERNQQSIDLEEKNSQKQVPQNESIKVIQLIEQKQLQQKQANEQHNVKDRIERKNQTNQNQNNKISDGDANKGYKIFPAEYEEEEDQILQELMKQQEQKYLQKQDSMKHYEIQKQKHNKFTGANQNYWKDQLLQPKINLNNTTYEKNKTYLTSNFALYGPDADFLKNFQIGQSQRNQKAKEKPDQMDNDYFENKEYGYKRNYQSFMGTRSRSGIRFGEQAPRKKKKEQFILPDSCQILEISD